MKGRNVDKNGIEEMTKKIEEIVKKKKQMIKKKRK